MDSYEKGILFQTPKNQCKANTKTVSIWTQPSHFKGVHFTELHCQSSSHTPFANLLWRWNNLLLMVVADFSGLQSIWPENTLSFGTQVRTFVALFPSLAPQNSSHTSCPSHFVLSLDILVDPLSEALMLWSARVSASWVGLSSSNSKQNTAVKIPPLRCNFTQVILEVSSVFFLFPTAVSTVLHYLRIKRLLEIIFVKH